MVQDKFLVIPNIAKNGGAVRYNWTSELRNAIVLALSLSPLNSKYLLITIKGNTHNEDSLKSAWRRTMKKALANGLTKALAERYLINKSVTDCDDLGAASKTVGYTSTSVTKQHYSMLD